MLSADELRSYARGIRDKTMVADDRLLTVIENDVAAYREYLREPRPQLPPPELAELLPLMGWLLLEASLAQLWLVEAGYESLDSRRRARSEAAAALIDRAADAARALPWPEFAPRALGAIRAQALAASKRDTESGYDDAWILHQEAAEKHASYLDSHGSDPSRERYVRDLGEILLQLALAETGTACRTAERVLSRWAEEKEAGTWGEQDSARWTQRMFRQLADGVETGMRALDVAAGIARRWGFTDRVTEERLALPTSHRLPAIMTARANLLMLSMCPEMEDLGRLPDGFDNWAEARRGLVARFEECYRHIERPVLRGDGQPWPLLPENQRSMVQLRLHLALAVPGHDFPAELVFDPCVGINPLTDEAVTAMSSWLAESDAEGNRRGDANVIGSATKPSFVRSVAALRRIHGGTGEGYVEWRRAWFVLDRHANEAGRRRRVEEALAEADVTG
jgi:hypothetical protein